MFEEFNNGNETKYKLDTESLLEHVEPITEDKKLPNVSIDEYMKNFNAEEFKENEINSLFNEDDIFPNIPI